MLSVARFIRNRWASCILC